MSKCLKSLCAILRDRQAVTMLEYAIMGSIIAGALVTAVPLLTNAVNTEFTAIASTISKG